MSHSRYEDFAKCGEMYRLKRIERVPITPSIYAIAGTVFHSWTDLYDSEPFGPDAVTWWQGNLSKAVGEAELESGYSLKEWDNPARKAGANDSAFQAFRDEIGPDMISKYIEWRKNSGWGVEHIELELTYRLGDIEGVAKVDRVFYRPVEKDYVAIDTKTWSKRRVTAQLPTYLVALRQSGFAVGSAGYYEARKGSVTELNSYKYWDENRLAALHVTAAEMISEGRFLPAPGENCRLCDVRRHCVFALD
jgi:putative RecB family exonuclease